MAIKPTPAGKRVSQELPDGSAPLTTDEIRREVSSAAHANEQRLQDLILLSAVRIDEYSPAAPDVVKREAALRFIGYLIVADTGAMRSFGAQVVQMDFVTNHSAMFRNCGAAALLSPWRTRIASVV